ncbi:MAG: N-formylglutamate amidohydrolase [Planctomycetota bacterium]|nr:N-formylglutamate amidohydrolase [Planctomycetota bacterium]
MKSDGPRSIPGVSDVTVVRGVRSHGVPDILLEVPHGATRARDYDELRRELVGDFPADLQAFFFVNTDVGAPEVALRVAELVVAAEPERACLVLRCLVPRTFVDCNRDIDATTLARASVAGEMTAGLHAWVRDPRDRKLLLERYGAYRSLATDAYAQVCGGGGRALMVHSYAPRSVDVAVDDRIVESLRAAYAPDRVESWPLRASVDLIVDTPEGERLADPALAAAAKREFEAAGFDVVENGAYTLHPVSLAHVFARAYPRQTLCLELRRDLLMRAFTPFAEMHADPARVERVAGPLARAVRSDFGSSAP